MRRYRAHYDVIVMHYLNQGRSCGENLIKVSHSTKCIQNYIYKMVTICPDPISVNVTVRHIISPAATAIDLLIRKYINQVEGRFWIYAQHVNLRAAVDLRAARKFTGTWSPYMHHAAVSSPSHLGTNQTG